MHSKLQCGGSSLRRPSCGGIICAGIIMTNFRKSAKKAQITGNCIREYKHWWVLLIFCSFVGLSFHVASPMQVNTSLVSLSINLGNNICFNQCSPGILPCSTYQAESFPSSFRSATQGDWPQLTS